MFCDQPITYPDLPIVLVGYLGTATDVVSTMTYKTLKRNGEYVCRTTVHPLIITELYTPEHKEQRKDFYTSVVKYLGPHATIYDVDRNDLTFEL